MTDSDRIDRKKRNVAYAILFTVYFLLGMVLYAPAIRAFFHSDDFVLIDTVRRDGPFGMWSGPHYAFFRPLISVTLYVDWLLWGVHPLGYHLANVLVHLVNVFLVFVLGRQLVRLADPGIDSTVRDTMAALGSLLFLTLPAHAEAVTWISGRTDVYANAFWLAAFIAYLRYRDNSAEKRWLVLSLVSFVLALLCKEVSVTLPFTLLVLEALFPQRAEGAVRPWRALLVRLVPFLLLVPIYILVRWRVLGVLVGGYGASQMQFTVPIIRNAVYWYITCSFFVLNVSYALILKLIWVSAALLLLRYFFKPRPNRLLWFLLIAFAIAALPALTLANPFPDGAGGRYVYQPSVFSTLAIVVLLSDLIRWRGLSRWPLLLLAALFSVQLFRLNGRWRNAGELTRQCVDSYLAAVPAGVPVVVLTAPDSLGPIYVLRNGLANVSGMFHGKDSGPVRFTTAVFLAATDESVESTPTNGEALTWKLRVQQLPAYPEDLPIWAHLPRLIRVDQQKPEDQVIVPLAGDTATIHLTPQEAQGWIVTYRDGAMVVVHQPSSSGLR